MLSSPPALRWATERVSLETQKWPKGDLGELNGSEQGDLPPVAASFRRSCRATSHESGAIRVSTVPEEPTRKGL